MLGCLCNNIQSIDNVSKRLVSNKSQIQQKFSITVTAGSHVGSAGDQSLRLLQVRGKKSTSRGVKSRIKHKRGGNSLRELKNPPREPETNTTIDLYPRLIFSYNPVSDPEAVWWVEQESQNLYNQLWHLFLDLFLHGGGGGAGGSGSVSSKSPFGTIFKTVFNSLLTFFVVYYFWTQFKTTMWRESEIWLRVLDRRNLTML